MEFHYAILTATRNPFVIEIGKTAYELYRYKMAELARQTGGREQALTTHRLYLKALNSQDPEKRLELKRQIDANYRKLTGQCKTCPRSTKKKWWSSSTTFSYFIRSRYGRRARLCRREILASAG